MISLIHRGAVPALTALLIVLFAGSMSAAQPQANQDKCSIVGTVTDASHAVVPGAEVILTNVSVGGLKLFIPISANGECSEGNLYPGYYNLTVRAPGFAEKIWDTLTVKPGNKLQLDAVLNVASAPGTAPAAEPVAAAQDQTAAAGGEGSISGTVTDSTQAIVPDAKAVLTSDTGEKRESSVNAKGVYSFTHLRPGDYKLTITAPNFADYPFDTLKMADGMELTLDATLHPAGEKSEVSVEASSVGKVETETASVSGTITEKEVVSIGLNGRNFTQLIALAPGVSNQTGQDEAKVGVQGSVKYSVNGGRVEYNTFEVDGSDVLNTGLNGASSTLMVYPSLDAIQEVKVLTSNYGAQYGRTASGTVQVTTKSGTPAFHGNLYEFLRNEKFNSRNYFDTEYIVPPVPGSTAPPQLFGNHAPLYRRQDFGGTIGGPLYIPHVFNEKKDKTFFFFSEEMRLEKTPVDYNQAVPGLKERGLILTSNGIQPNLVPNVLGNGVYRSFDFTDVCAPSGAAFTRAAYPDCPTDLNGNPLPFLDLPGSGYGVDKNAIAMLNSNLIPLPNSPYGCNIFLPNVGSNVAGLDPSDPNHCYVSAVSPSTYWREELFRIDQTITSKLRLSFRYVHDEWDTTVLTPQWGVVRDAFPTIQNRFYGPGISLVANVSDTISSTLLNTVVLSYTDSGITLVDENGPGNARFQRDPSLSEPLVTDPANPGQCNPLISVDPVTGVPECGMGYIFNNGFGGKMPGLNFSGTNAAYGGEGFAVDPSYMPWGHTNPTYAIRDDVGKSLGNGRHTAQFGVQYIYSQRNQNNNAIGAASGDTQGLLTFSNLSHSTGNAFADFMIQEPLFNGAQYQGFIQSFTQDSTNRRYYQRFQIAEPYFQDDWKVTPRLTVNLGLRVSLFGTYREKNHNAWNWVASDFVRGDFSVDPVYGELLYKGSTVPISQFAPGDPVVQGLGLVQCGQGGVPVGCMKGHLFNPAPRVGFAWDPQGDGKTSIRGGYGIFFEHGTANEANTGSLEASAPLVLSMTQALPLNYPCIGNIGYGSQFNSANPCLSPIAQFFPNSMQPQGGDAFPIDVTGIPTKVTWPYAQQWSFGIQRELSHSLVLTMAYVGSQGTHLAVERQLNQLQPLPLNQNPFGPNEPLTIADCTSAPPGYGSSNHPGDGLTPFLLQGGALVTPTSPAYVHLQAACTNPFIPNVNSLAGHGYPGLGRSLSLQNLASSTYHGLQFTMRHVSGPLTAGISYSYSHSIDDSSDRSDPVLVNSFDLRENRASSNFDERHLVNLSYVYRLPLRNLVDSIHDWTWSERSESATPSPKDCCLWSKLFLDGWELSGVTIAQSGVPFTVINSAGNTGISLTDNAGVASNYGIAASYPDVNKYLPATIVRSNPQSFGPLIGNPAQFVAPRGLTFGDAGRNYLNNPSRLNFDLSLIKHTRIRETGELEFRAEAFNIFNHTEFRLYDVDNPGRIGNNIISCYAGQFYSAGFEGKGADCITGASFLHPIDAHRPRTIQLGLKLAF